MRSVSVLTLSLTILASAGLTLIQADRLGLKCAEGTLATGAAVPPLVAKTLAGDSTVIPVGNKPIVIYVFNPASTRDRESSGDVVELAQRAGDRFHFIGLALSGEHLPEYLAANPLPFPVYRNPTAVTAMSYRIGGGTKTIVVSGDGRIERSWDGAFDAAEKPKVEAFFGVKL